MNFDSQAFNTVGKTVSAVMTDVLVYLTVRHNLLQAKCFGGLLGHTMTDSLLYLINNIKNMWRQQQVATIVFLDIASAFPNAITTRLLPAGQHGVSWLLYSDCLLLQSCALTGTPHYHLMGIHQRCLRWIMALGKVSPVQ